MKIKMETKQLKIDPELAKSILRENYINQRAIRKDHVEYLKNELKNDRFREGTTIAICTTPDGKNHLINGQHTLTAIIDSNSSIFLSVEKYQCKNMPDVALLFSTYDRQRTRTQGDIFNAYNLAESLDLTITHTGQYCAALNFIFTTVLKYISGRKAAPDEIIEYANRLVWRYERFLDATHGCGNVSGGKARVPLVSAAILTAEHPKYFEFWNAVTTDDGLKVGDPRKILHRFLQTTSMSGTGNKAKVSTMAMFKTCIYCWNKYLSGQLIKSFQIDKVLETHTISGTIFSGGLGLSECHKLINKKTIG